MSSVPRLTTTTYGVLGLLAVRPHSTYELAKAMDRSVGRVWPRATSKLFEEPKKLVQHGYATALEDAVGRRPRTVYTITRTGRRALSEWLAEPGDGPSLEFEGLVKLIFADLGTRDAALGSLARAHRWAVEQNVGNIEAGEKFLAAEEGLYADRRATTLLLGAFLTDFYKLVADWADWATDEVESWPEDISSHRIPADRTRDVLERARWSEDEQSGS